MKNFYFNDYRLNIDKIVQIFEEVERKNAEIFEKIIKSSKNKEDVISKYSNLFSRMLENYLDKICEIKYENNHNFKQKIFTVGKYISSILTGTYHLGIVEKYETYEEQFEQISRNSEQISNVILYSDNKELAEITNENKLANTIINGLIATGIIETENKEEALERFNKMEDKLKLFFKHSISNILNANVLLANGIAKVSGLDSEESKKIDGNMFGKLVGGLSYEFLSGTLLTKRTFTPVKDSQHMQEKIAQEGILHFSSPQNIQKIMESGNIKCSNILESDVTAKKSFFFAGTPTFEDLLINIEAHSVMAAIRIKPTQQQMENLKYRALDDGAVSYDGSMKFLQEQAEIVYYGLKYDDEKKQIYLGEISEEESKVFKPSEEVEKAYGFIHKKNLLNNAKMQAMGIYAQYKHHQRLQQFQKALDTRNIFAFENVTDKTLVGLRDIEQCYVDTKNQTLERRGLMEKIKKKLTKTKQQQIQKERYNEDNER